MTWERHRKLVHPAFALALALAATLTSLAASEGVARATDDRTKAAARELANEAKRDFDAGRFEDAKTKFQRAYAVARVPTLAVWTGRASAKCGQLVAASELYRQATQLEPNDLWVGSAQQRAQADARNELEELQPRIPRLRIRVEGSALDEVDVSMDGVHVSNALLGVDIPADPGRRHIVGKTRDQTVQQAVELHEGGRHETVLTFAEAAPVLDQPLQRAVHAALAEPTAGSASSSTATLLTARPVEAEPTRVHRPFYTTWWFWSAVGVVAVAGGVTTYLLTHPAGGPCSDASFPCTEVK